MSSCQDVKEFGKENLTDGDESTSWASGSGEKQWIKIKFDQPVTVEQIGMMFQGGFSSRCVNVFFSQSSSSQGKVQHTFYPKDLNSSQLFAVEPAPVCDSVVIRFDDFVDFYGRIILYSVNLIGSEWKQL